MKRILIIGSGGAGKSTLALRLGETIGIEVVHLDRIHWKPGWTESPKDKFRDDVEEILKKERWIMDGNYGGTMEMRLKACDTVIFLDFPRPVCLYRVIKRRLTYRGTHRPDMTEGCHEKIDFEFLHWIWTFPTRAKSEIEERLKKIGSDKTIIRLRSPREVKDFLASVKSR
ncbi:MAG TPA: DNA topology modulation protein [Pyrinomonadaceae bacterium]|jgi:adenylate kinase family enzyme